MAAGELPASEKAMNRIIIILFLLVNSSGCVFVGGYSSERGGWFIWPGTIVIFLIVAVLFLLLRRRG